MPYLKTFTQSELQQYLNLRPNEVKLGEKVKIGIDFNEEVQYVILGIPEDIGVRANYGIGGAHTTWEPFLKAMLNIQSTNSLSGDNICLLGQLNCSNLQQRSRHFAIKELREAVTLIDQQVENLIFQITAAGKTPIVIGGGHNNAYPIIKGAARGYHQCGKLKEIKLNCINLDAHADFRLKEGRHSGNGFRYAFEEGYLDRYAIIGLHRNYNAQSIVDKLTAERRIDFSFWEDIFLDGHLSFDKAINHALNFIADRPYGIELDLDCIANTWSSALTPSGISPTLARRYINQSAMHTSVTYLHICEGIAVLEDGKQDHSIGKLIAYLVSDFIRVGNKN